MDDTKIQWHPGFCSAMHLEFVRDKEILEFHEEFTLNTKPIIIDLLVIQKKGTLNLENEIGKMFKGHNIMEYKSPDDELGVDVYFKAYAYACLYKSGGENENSIRADDVTITLVRERKPVTLFKYLEKRDYIISLEYPGIYYVRKSGFFDTQIVVTRELDEDLHIWLRSLTMNLDKTSAEKLISRIQLLTNKDEKENADSVLKVAVEANDSWFEMLKKEDDNMEALRRLMQPELEEAGRAGEVRGEDMMSRLIQILMRENRQDEIMLAASNEQARKEMYRKYGIND